MSTTSKDMILSEIQRDAAGIEDRIRKSGEPEYIDCENGKRLVLVDEATYVKMADLADRLDTILSVRESLESMERGEGIHLDIAIAEIQAKYGLPKE